MKLSVLKFLGASLLATLAGSAIAAPIVGQIDIGAFAVTPTINFTTNSVSFTPASPANNAIVNGADGDYSGLLGQMASYHNFVYDPFVGPQTIWSTAGASFSLVGVTSITETANGLILTGYGTASLSGFDDTAGTWSFSADRARSTAKFTFSSTVISPINVPDSGSTVALLGAGLVVMGLVSRRRLG